MWASYNCGARNGSRFRSTARHFHVTDIRDVDSWPSRADGSNCDVTLIGDVTIPKARSSGEFVLGEINRTDAMVRRLSRVFREAKDEIEIEPKHSERKRESVNVVR